MEWTVSTERLREAEAEAEAPPEVPLREVRRRLMEESSRSSKGLGRVEQGSEETARSLDSAGDLEAWSIWLVRVGIAGCLEAQRRGSYARDSSAAALS